MASSLTGHCVPPFLDESLFPSEGGFVHGRFCAPFGAGRNETSCCLPCPTTDWTYGNSLKTYNTTAGWLNVVGLIFLVFLLISYAVLPTQQTRSHYLSICLVVSVAMLELGFAIPLFANPRVCYNDITPNDMYSSTECAWGGAFVVAGGLSTALWILIRAFSMNLQICWDIVPGQKFFYASQAIGWGVAAALFTATMTATGVSFRFGASCHVNHANSLADFWGPLLAFEGAAGILQLATFIYCIHVYLKNLFLDRSHEQSNQSSGGFGNSARTAGARAVYQRLKKVLWLQWRGIAIVTICLVDVIFFAIVFVYLDGMQASVHNNFSTIEPWLLCLVHNPTERSKCLDLANEWVLDEEVVSAVLILLSITGLQVFFFLSRPALLPAWFQFLFSSSRSGNDEFVSLDARPDVMNNMGGPTPPKYAHVRGHQSTTFEMQQPARAYMKSPPLPPLDAKSPPATISPTHVGSPGRYDPGTPRRAQTVTTQPVQPAQQHQATQRQRGTWTRQGSHDSEARPDGRHTYHGRPLYPPNEAAESQESLPGHTFLRS